METVASDGVTRSSPGVSSLTPTLVLKSQLTINSATFTPNPENPGEVAVSVDVIGVSAVKIRLRGTSLKICFRIYKAETAKR